MQKMRTNMKRSKPNDAGDIVIVTNADFPATRESKKLLPTTSRTRITFPIILRTVGKQFFQYLSDIERVYKMKSPVTI